MRNKLNLFVLILAAVLSVVALGTAARTAQAGIDCYVGPGNCGCLLDYGTCTEYVMGEECGWEGFYWNRTVWTTDIYQNGKGPMGSLVGYYFGTCSWNQPAGDCSTCG